jgi:DNA-binding transcriptional regulator YhcF (GntR family)
MKTSAAPELLAHLPIDRAANIPLHEQLYNGFRRAILTGMLRGGQRVPSTRILARELGMSRLPVLSAYDQLLHEGYFAARTGAGTYVSAAPPDAGATRVWRSGRTRCGARRDRVASPHRTRGELRGQPRARNVGLAGGAANQRRRVARARRRGGHGGTRLPWRTSGVPRGRRGDRAGARRRRGDRRRRAVGGSPKDSRRLRHSVASISARHVDVGHTPVRAARLGRAQRRVDSRRRLRQRVSVRQPAARRVARAGYPRTRRLYRNVQQGALSDAAHGIPRRANRALGIVPRSARRVRHLLADAVSVGAHGIFERRTLRAASASDARRLSTSAPGAARRPGAPLRRAADGHERRRRPGLLLGFGSSDERALSAATKLLAEALLAARARPAHVTAISKRASVTPS